MPRPRTPLAKARATGRDQRDPARFTGRNEPSIDNDLGDAPDWLIDTATARPRQAWDEIRETIPWLNNSHRGLTSIAATILGRVIGGQEVGVNALNLLRQCYGAMGATPADASKAGPRPDGEADDPAEKYFRGR